MLWLGISSDCVGCPLELWHGKLNVVVRIRKCVTDRKVWNKASKVYQCIIKSKCARDNNHSGMCSFGLAFDSLTGRASCVLYHKPHYVMEL